MSWALWVPLSLSVCPLVTLSSETPHSPHPTAASLYLKEQRVCWSLQSHTFVLITPTLPLFTPPSPLSLSPSLSPLPSSPSRVLQNIPLDDIWHDAVMIAKTNVRAIDIVLAG